MQLLKTEKVERIPSYFKNNKKVLIKYHGFEGNVNGRNNSITGHVYLVCVDG